MPWGPDRRRLIRRATLSLFVLTSLAAPPSAGAAPQGKAVWPAPAQPVASRPFSGGERFTYALSWLNLRAGTAVMEVRAHPFAGEPAQLELLTRAWSAPFISRFYPVDNRVESIVDAATLAPRRLIFHRREGKRKNDFDLTFRQDQGVVTSIKDGVTDVIPIQPDTQDALSCLYYVRSLPSLRPGDSIFLNVHHDKKNYRLEVRVEGLERVAGAWGEREAIRVLVVMPFQGIFLNEGNIRVWFTNDARHVPLRMKAKVIIGSVVADLIEGYGDGAR